MASEYDMLVHTEGAYNDAKREIAKSMLADGVLPEKVTQYTGLTPAEIHALVTGLR